MKKRGCLWWVFIGWWWWPIRAIIFDLPRLLLKKLIRKPVTGHNQRGGAQTPAYRKPSPPPAPQMPTPEPVKIELKKIAAADLNFDEVITRYLSGAHYKSPAEYNFLEYHRAEFDCMLQNIKPVEIALSEEKVLRNSATLTPYEKSANITKRTKRERLQNFIVLDVETTGLKPGGNDIIEVSAIKFENFVPVSIFTTLLKPRKPIPPTVTNLTNITDEMVDNSPRFAQIKSALQEYIADYPIVAHNAAFDIKFLFVSGLEFPEKQVFFDTLELSRRRIKDWDGGKLSSYALAEVCAECGIYFDGAHRSSADALATGLLFMEIIRQSLEADSLLDI